MDFDIPKEVADYLVVLDDFIEKEIKPLQNENDNIRFFDHRREDARTDWDRGGLPNGGMGSFVVRGAHEGRPGRSLPICNARGIWWPEWLQPRDGNRA